MATALDVATYLLEKLGPMTAMKLQKLVYYCQAWSLVWDERPMFDDPIEAWLNGPVVPKLYEMHRGRFMIECSDLKAKGGNPDALNDDAKATADQVIKGYGDKSAQWLSDLTHKEAPWRLARAGLGDDERGSSQITLVSMEEYYTSIFDRRG